jgi:hypothetical protein
VGGVVVLIYGSRRRRRRRRRGYDIDVGYNTFKFTEGIFNGIL